MIMAPDMQIHSLEARRVEALHRLGVLNQNASDYYDAVTRLARDMFGVSGAYISLMDSDRQWLKSVVGLCSPSKAREQSFCTYTIEQAKMMVVEDTLLDERLAGNLLVTGPAGIRFYAGAPLLTAQGFAIGTLCLVDTKPRQLDAAGQAKLAGLAQLLMSHISLGRAIGHVDAISGMPNKFQMGEDLAALSKQHTGQPRVLVIIDMPDPTTAFEIASVLGLGVFDDMVRGVAARLKQLFDGRAHVYHMTDSRFAVLSDGADTQGFIDYLYGLEAALKVSLQNATIPLNLPSFGGIVVFDLCEQSSGDAPRKAIAAANQALLGQQRWMHFSDAEDVQHQRAFRLLNDVQASIREGRFRLVYQPKHDVASGHCMSAEALLRWDHAELGQVSPAEFIPLIEKTALIGPLTDWVIRAAIQQMSQWHAAGALISVAINLSAYNFEEADIVERLAAVCLEFAVDPRYVEIECTEGIWMEGAGILETLNAIRALGMNLALDDFGTGYSNFSYLQKVPATVVKVDQSLIRHVHSNPRDQSIVRSLIALAKELNYRVIAEGVETVQSLNLIRSWGCDTAQGYYFAKPLPPQAFLDHVRGYA